jgi:hypothetical protein
MSQSRHEELLVAFAQGKQAAYLIINLPDTLCL